MLDRNASIFVHNCLYVDWSRLFPCLAKMASGVLDPADLNLSLTVSAISVSSVMGMSATGTGAVKITVGFIVLLPFSEKPLPVACAEGKSGMACQDQSEAPGSETSVPESPY